MRFCAQYDSTEMLGVPIRLYLDPCGMRMRVPTHSALSRSPARPPARTAPKEICRL